MLVRCMCRGSDCKRDGGNQEAYVNENNSRLDHKEVVLQRVGTAGVISNGR